MAEARFAQWHERALLDPAAEVSRLGVGYDLAGVADRLQIAGYDFVERCSFGAGDLDDAVLRRRKRPSATMAATSSAAMGWNRSGEILTVFPSVLEAAAAPRNSKN